MFYVLIDKNATVERVNTINENLRIRFILNYTLKILKLDLPKFAVWSPDIKCPNPF